jgi:hypothetical protein
MDTSGKIRSSDYSIDERLLKDDNRLYIIMDWSVDNEICHHGAKHSQNMKIDTKTEVVASSVLQQNAP